MREAITNIREEVDAKFSSMHGSGNDAINHAVGDSAQVGDADVEHSKIRDAIRAISVLTPQELDALLAAVAPGGGGSTCGGSSGAGSTAGGNPVVLCDGVIAKYFERYDMDQSGTLNTEVNPTL